MVQSDCLQKNKKKMHKTMHLDYIQLDLLEAHIFM